MHHISIPKRVVAIVGALLTLAGVFLASASPAAAVDGRKCKSVLFPDGKNMATPCVFVNTSAGNGVVWYASTRTVWNVPTPNGHTDVINARWYGNAGLTCAWYSIADGDTASGSPCPTSTTEQLTNTVWVQLNSSYTGYCRRVYFAHTGAISEGACP